jgi:hypothetical protein
VTEALSNALAGYFAQGAWNIFIDALDIAVVALVVYRVMLLLRGTRALQMGVGLMLVFVTYEIARRIGLLTLYSLLDGLLTSMVLIIVVIFQSDIRRALMRFGGRAWWVPGSSAKATSAIEEVIKAATMLAQKRIGGLIVFEREAMLEEFIQRGTLLDSVASKELLYGLFIPSFENPLHDGGHPRRAGVAGGRVPAADHESGDRPHARQPSPSGARHQRGDRRRGGGGVGRARRDQPGVQRQHGARRGRSLAPRRAPRPVVSPHPAQEEEAAAFAIGRAVAPQYSGGPACRHAANR